MAHLITTAQRSEGLHPDGEYSRGAKWFHWLTVPPLFILLLSGMTIRFVSDDARMASYTVHESLGLLVLLLAVARLTWRLRHSPPPMTNVASPLERTVANTVHTLFYVVLILQPVLGFFTTNAYGFPQRGATAFLGFIDLPKIMDAAPELARTLHWAHSITGWLLVLLILTHVSGVLSHHVGRRDGTLLRMI